MRICLLFLSILATSLYPASVQVGGRIAAINSVNCWPAGAADFSKPGKDLAILQCRIDNNAAAFHVDFDFSRFAAFTASGRGGLRLTGLTLHQVSGSRGEGLSDPSGMEVLPLLHGNVFTWTPGVQSTSTRDYVVEFRGSWTGSGLGSAAAAGPASPVWAAMSASL